MFSGTYESGVFLSTDNGANWAQINDGLTNTTVRALQINSNEYVFAGTYGGVFRSNQPTTSIEQIDNKIPSSFVLEQNYPNPFNPGTKIRFTVPQDDRRETRNVTLRVYDVLGNEVATLVDEELPAGEYEVEFSANGGLASGIRNLQASRKRLASGVYFYSLHVNDFVQSRKMMLLK